MCIERGEEFIDEELMLTSAEMPTTLVDSMVEADLIEDALS